MSVTAKRTDNQEETPGINAESLVWRGENAEECKEAIHKMLEQVNDRELRIVYSFIKALIK